MNIIVEGPDKAGKSTFIRQLINELITKEITTPVIRHFDRPNRFFPRFLQADTQRLDYFWMVENSFPHYTEESQQVLICDRFHLGEMVYPNLYRNYSVDYQFKLESRMPENTILVLLTAHQEIIKARFENETYLKEEDIRKCIKLFDRAYGRSIIGMKMRVYAKHDRDRTIDENQNLASLISYGAIRDLVSIIANYKTNKFVHTYQVKSVEEIESHV